MLRATTSTMLAFKNANYHHGDIQPNNIMIDNEGCPKLIDNSLINYGKTAYHKMIYGEDYTSPLSPALMDAYRVRKVDPIHDKIKSDVFSLGMTTLSAANNKNFNYYYDWSAKRILMRDPNDPVQADQVDPKKGKEDEDRVGQGLQNMTDNGYTPELVNLTRRMLDYDEPSRISLEGVQEAINQHYASPGGTYVDNNTQINDEDEYQYNPYTNDQP